MTSTAIANRQNNAPVVARGITKEQYDIISSLMLRNTKNITRDDVVVFKAYCDRNHLDPIAGDCYYWKFKDRPVIVTSYHCLTARAQRTGEFQGWTDTEWGKLKEDGEIVWRTYWTDRNNPPFACRVGLRRKGWPDVQYTTVYFHEKENKTNCLWQSIPLQMLEKCARAKALKTVFADAIGSEITTREEIESGDEVQPQIIDVKHEEAEERQLDYETLSLPNPANADWDDDIINDCYLPNELRGRGIAYSQLCTDETLAYQAKDGKSSARRMLYVWQKSPSSSPELVDIANRLLEKYPSKNNQPKPISEEVQPPANVTA